MSRISHAQEDPGRRMVPRIDLSLTQPSETVLPMLQWRPGGFDNNEVLEAYPSLLKPSGTDSMLLGSSPVFLLRSPVFLRGTEQLAFSLLIIMSGGTGNSGERSRSQMRAGFVFDTLIGGYVSGVETENVTQKSTCSHAMRIMERHGLGRCDGGQAHRPRCCSRNTDQTTLHRRDLTSSCGAFPTPNGQQWHLPRWQSKAASGKNCRRISAS